MKLGKLTLFERKAIGSAPDPLLWRYILFRLPAFGVYLHHFMRSDYDRALHDHPWPFVSVILRGGYHEAHDHTVDGSTAIEWRGPGSVLLRPAEWRHRVILDAGRTSWSLILVGRRSRKWGFWLPSGWCWWRKHNYRDAVCEDDVLWPEGGD